MTREFFVDLLERAGKTFVQALAGVWVANQSTLVGFNWRTAFIVALGAAITSVLTSFGSAGVTKSSTASLVGLAYKQPLTDNVPELPVASAVVKPIDPYNDVDNDTATD